MRLVFTTVKDKLDRKYGCFELFGFDFLVDSDLNPQLIEVNTNPALYTDTQVQKDLLPRLVEDVVKLALAAHPEGKETGPQVDLGECTLPYSVLYKEE